MNNNPRVLCVDDEPNLLAALARTLYQAYDVTTASGGAEALKILRAEEPFAIILSDMRMPEMNGAEFLSQAKIIAPDSVRILLTGQTDVETAMVAVNQGAIFRFMCKPCPNNELLSTLEIATAQYRLVMAEKQLLEQTLTGAIRVLADMLALSSPVAFQRTAFLQRCQEHVVKKLHWENAWVYEVAATLSQIGCVAIGDEVVQRAMAGTLKTSGRCDALRQHPETAFSLLEQIPRLENVAAIIRYQAQTVPDDAHPDVKRGAALLCVGLALERACRNGSAPVDALASIATDNPHLSNEIFDALKDFSAAPGESRLVAIQDIQVGEILEQDVHARTGIPLLQKGNEISHAALERLRRFARAVGVDEPIRVRAQAPQAAG